MTWIQLDPDDLSAVASTLRDAAGVFLESGVDLTAVCCCALPTDLAAQVDRVVAAVRNELAAVSDGYATDAGGLDTRAATVQDEPLSRSASTVWSAGADADGADLLAPVAGAPSGASDTVPVGGGGVPSAFSALVSSGASDQVAIGGDPSPLSALTSTDDPDVVTVDGSIPSGFLSLLDPSPRTLTPAELAATAAFDPSWFTTVEYNGLVSSAPEGVTYSLKPDVT